MSRTGGGRSDVNGVPVKEIFDEHGISGRYYHLVGGQWKGGLGMTYDMFHDEKAYADPDTFQKMVELLTKNSTSLIDATVDEQICEDCVSISEKVCANLSMSSVEKSNLLSILEKRFHDHSELHLGTKWVDVENLLRKNQETMNKLHVLEKAGFAMTVFREDEDSFVFRMTHADITDGIINKEYRNITYDDAKKKTAELGVELADVELYRKSMLTLGRVWLATDDVTRDLGYAFDGDNMGIFRGPTSASSDYGSFCAVLRVPKVV